MPKAPLPSASPRGTAPSPALELRFPGRRPRERRAPVGGGTRRVPRRPTRQGGKRDAAKDGKAWPLGSKGETGGHVRGGREAVPGDPAIQMQAIVPVRFRL